MVRWVLVDEKERIIMENPVWSYLPWPQKKQGVLNLLSDLPAFVGISRKSLVLVERMLHERKYRKGEIVFNEGEPGAGMFIVISGEVEIFRVLPTGEKTVLTNVREKSFFGELALLDEIPRSASACAVSETLLLGFSKPSLEALCDRNPRLGITILSNLARILCKRLLKSNEAFEVLQSKLKKDSLSFIPSESVHGNV